MEGALEMSSAEKQAYIKVEELVKALVFLGIDRSSIDASSTSLCWRYKCFTILLAKFEDGKVDIYTALSISDWLLEIKEGLIDE